MKREVMTRQVRIAELKANLSRHLRAAQRGQRITVLDRDTPIAEIVPLGKDTRRELETIKPPPGTPGFWDGPTLPPLDLGFDIVDLLLEDRARR